MCKVPALRRGLSRLGMTSAAPAKTKAPKFENTDDHTAESFSVVSIGVHAEDDDEDYSRASELTTSSGASELSCVGSSLSQASLDAARLRPMQDQLSTDNFFNLKSPAPLERSASTSCASSLTLDSDDRALRRHRSRGHDEFSEVLDQALQPDSPVKNAILKRSTAIYADESFRFYAAILEWERLVRDEQSFFHRWGNWKKPESEAKRIVSLFVADAGRYANGCLSSAIKTDLVSLHDLKTKRGPCNPYFFEDAKDELRRDIWSNPTLKAMVLPQYSETAARIEPFSQKFYID